MPVRPRGNGYEATVNNKALPGGRLRKLFPTEAQASQWELKVKAKLAAGEPITTEESRTNGAPATLKELFDLTCKKYWKGKAGEKSSMTNARKVMEFLGENASPLRITEQKIDELVFHCEAQGLADATINHRLNALSKALTYAYEREWIPKKPKFEFKKLENGRIRYITETEEREALAYFQHVGNQDMRDVYVVGVDTGMRMGEILRLEKRDIHENLLTVWKNKSNRPRSIPMTKRVQEVIERRSRLTTARIFDKWTHSKVGHYWDQMRRHQGLLRDPQFVPHVMRHTFCSRLVQRGVPIVTVKELAGHSSIQVTMRYSHLAPQNLASAIEALE
jgi:integrase